MAVENKNGTWKIGSLGRREPKKGCAMSLPSEYMLENGIRSIDDVNVYAANHPIHGKVDVYLPDKSLPPQPAAVVKRRLYRMGLQLRNLSLLDVPLLVKALEVSQNPNEPYIVTGHAEHDLEQFLSNGVTIKPKRMFAMLSHILEAMINLAADGWVVDRVHPRQIKIPDPDAVQILFSIVEGAQQQIDLTREEPPHQAPGHSGPRADVVHDAGRTVAVTQKIKETGSPDDPNRTRMLPYDPNGTPTVDGDVCQKIADLQKKTARQNIGILGQIAYQLLFGRQFLGDDKTASANLCRLPKRCRRILENALSPDEQRQYPAYEPMLKDLKRALSRNRRAVVASIPVLVVLAATGSYVGYERYRQHKIATSEAGQAIKSFLDIVSAADETLEKVELPKPLLPEPNEEQIMEPFDRITPLQ